MFAVEITRALATSVTRFELTSSKFLPLGPTYEERYMQRNAYDAVRDV